MRCAVWASDSEPGPLTCPLPSRCPYCPADAPSHWTGWGSYERYAGDRRDRSRRVAIPRYRCKVSGRTFSLLPDGLLPYCGERTGFVLSSLHALFVQKVALSTLSRRACVARGTLRLLRARFLRAVGLLRLPVPRQTGLPRHEGALKAASFLEVLAAQAPRAIADLFRGWKECEPKHSIVGVYAR